MQNVKNEERSTEIGKVLRSSTATAVIVLLPSYSSGSLPSVARYASGGKLSIRPFPISSAKVQQIIDTTKFF